MADRPPALRVAVAVLVAETAGLIALVMFLIIEDIAGAAASPGGAVAVTLYAALMAGVLALLSWALWRRRARARGPAIVLQLLLLPIGYYMLTGGVAWLGLAAMIAGLGGAAALLAPTTRAALGVH